MSEQKEPVVFMKPWMLIAIGVFLVFASSYYVIATRPIGPTSYIKEPTRPPQPTQNALPTATPGIVADYLSASYRVIEYLKHPTEPYYIVIATERVASTQQGNDSACGSIYTSSTCYFFIEPAYVYGAPERKFVGKLEGEGALLPETLKFVGPTLMQFDTADGDGGYGYQAHWQLDVTTGQFRLLSKKDTSQP